MHEFKWDSRREQAASLVAAGTKTELEIAAEVGINDATLRRWKVRPEFQARVQEHVGTVREELQVGSLADRNYRLQLYNDEIQRIERILSKRTKDGTITSVDVALLREKREYAKQAAQDLGQWTESRDVDAWLKFIDFDKLTDEQVERITNGEHPLKVIFGFGG